MITHDSNQYEHAILSLNLQLRLKNYLKKKAVRNQGFP